MRLAPREVFRAAVLILSLVTPVSAHADVPGIAVVLSAGAGALREPLLLALRLEFPDMTVQVLDERAREAGQVAVVRVERTATGLRVRVEETGTGVAVEREIPVDASGDEPAAHAAALLARSLLGVALLYEPDGRPVRASAPAPAPPPAAAPSAPSEPRPSRPAPAERPLRARARVQGAAEPSDALFVLSVGATVSSPFDADPSRFGGRLGLSARVGALPLEAGLEIALLASQAFALNATTTASYEGIPFGAWVRARPLRRPVELVPGVGLVVERSSVVAGSKTFADWNASLAAEARARLRILGALHLEVGLRGTYGLGGQEYRWREARVFTVGGSAWGADVGLSANVP